MLWVALDWPVDRLGDDYLFSVHSTQFLLVTMVAAPLLVTGTPGWLQVELTQPFSSMLRRVTRAPVALLVFQAVLVVTHVPPVVRLYAESDAAHFALHALWLLSALLFWLPILGDPPLVRPLHPGLKIAYLIAATVAPTVPASFLTWAETPLYENYAEAPRVFGLTAVDDLQLAGAIMKLGGGAVLWGFIIWSFLTWAADSRTPEPSQAPVETPA